jgi:hypothetical protein
MSLPPLGANGRMVVEETLQNVEPYAAQNTFASFGPARNSKGNNVPISMAGSPVRALQVLRDDQSACLVSMQRFRGKLRGRQGTFVLQGSEIVENGKIKATWFVVPGSATDDLSGLRGEGGFAGQFGKGSDGTLD